MDYLKKLLHVKRVLAMVLAVAITVTSVPATALAAPADVQTDTEQSVDESEQAPDNDGISDEDPAVTEEPTTEGDVSENADEVLTEEESVAGTSYADPDEAEAVAADDAETKEDAQYEIDVTELVNSTYTETKYYNGEARFVNGTKPEFNILYRIQLRRGKGDVANLYYNSGDSDVASITYEWQDADGKALGDGKAPTDAGSYKLAITLPKKEGEYKEAKATVDFTITQAVVTVTLETPEVVPGATKADVKLSIDDVESSDWKGFAYGQEKAEDNEISVSVAAVKEAGVLDDEGKEKELGDTDKFVKNKAYVVIPKVEFVGENKDKYAANYKLECKSVELTVGNLLETRVNLEVGSTYKKTEVELSDGSKVTAVKFDLSEATDDAISGLAKAIEDSAKVYEVVEKTVKKDDGTEETTKEDGAQVEAEVTGAWHAAVYSDWKEGDKYYGTLTVEGEMQSAPKGAGTYAYKVSYAGEDEVYGSSEAYVIVEIGTVELIVKPTLSKDKFFDGQTVADVLAAVTPEVVNADGSAFTIPDELKDRFWGTGYIDQSATQPYEPVFEVVKTDKDGNVTVFSPIDNSWREYDYEQERYVYKKLGPSEEGTTYAVRFTGSKAIYYAGGTLKTSKGINEDVDSWNGSYQVLIDEETRAAEGNIAKFEVTGESGVIDISGITGEDLKPELVLSAALDNTYKQADENYKETTKALTKVYDGKGLFADRASYKNAALKDAKTGAAVDTDPLADYTYTWYEWVDSSYDNFQTVKDAVIPGTPAEGEEAKDTVKWTFLDDDYWEEETWGNYIPDYAGIYKLVVSYNDPTGEYAAKDVEMYFVIDQQELILAMEEATYNGFSGVSAKEFVNSIDDTIGIGHSVVVDPDYENKPSKTEDWKRNTELEEDERYDYTYYVTWKVQKKTTDDEGKVDWDDFYGILDETSETNVYRITAEYGGSWNGNFAMAIDLNHFAADVKITKMGEKDLIIGDEDALIERTMEYNGKSIFEEFATDITSLNSPKLYTTVEGEKKAVTDEVSLTYVVTYDNGDEKIYEGKLPGVDDEDDWALQAINGGTYTISAYFRGDENYAPVSEYDAVDLAKITVTPKKLEIYLPELTVKAGEYSYNVTSTAVTEFFKPNVASINQEDAVEADIEKYFTKVWPGTYPAWTANNGYRRSPSFAVYEGKTQYYDKLTEIGNETYTLKLTNANLQGVAARNYEVVAEDVAITVIRSYSTLDTTSYGNITETAAADDVVSVENGSWRHDFATLEGVPLVTYNGVRGNWVAVQIKAPAQYDTNNVLDTAVYKQAIVNAGGTIVDETNGIITVLFNLTEKKEDAVFNIRWDDDYIEQFNLQFGKSECEVDLEYAVAPKSLAFNSPKKSMVVGEVQKLDVKVTKQQISDIICLGYEADENYLHVDEYGQVTALKAGGKGKVTVYPMHVVEINGVKVKERIEGKSATVTISVKGVAAPKISKVTAKDTYATVRYPFVDDAEYGYRREIYVMKGSKKAGDFEKEIDAMQNEQWQGHFEIAPRFVTLTNERNSRVWDDKKQAYLNIVELTLSGLEPNESYTVYVRNVSAVRTLGDGCQVQESHAGNVKTFKMTKPMLSYMSMGLKLKDGTEASLYDDKGNYVGYYTVQLADGSAQIMLDGYFPDRSDAADADDTVKYSLSPKNLTDKKKYTAPKISYSSYVGNFAKYWDNPSGYYGWASTKSSLKTSTLNDVVSIAKNGKITLKQPTMGSLYDCVLIVARDTVSGRSTSRVIRILAEADAIKPKNTSLSAGQSIALERLVEYKQKSKTLDQTYYYVTGRIDRLSVEEHLADSEILELDGDGYLTAYGKGSDTLTLTDNVLGKSVNVKVKISDLAAVKSMTVTNVIDNKATVQFVDNDYAYEYRVDVYDARNKLVHSAYGDWDDMTYENNSYEGVYGWRLGWYYHSVGTGAKAKRYITYRFAGLAQQSKYTVKVTVLHVYDGDDDSDDRVVSSKTVSKAFTTTKMPAAETPLRKDQTYNEDGVSISITERRTGNRISAYDFVSGNTYTIRAIPANMAAQYAATDSLTWTSSNKKVATVKSNAGSYNATLKAVKNGKTTIEVKSKILKQVIARYEISVRTVGDAYSGKPYYGDENLRNDRTDGTLTKELSLGVPVAIELTGGQTSMNYTFKAPEAGTYRRVVREVNGTKHTQDYTINAKGSSRTVYNAVTTDNGRTIWVELVESSKPGMENRTGVKLNEAKTGINNQWFVFTAPADGYYSFADNKTDIKVYDVSGEEPVQKEQADLYQLKKDEMVYLQIDNYSGASVMPQTVKDLTQLGSYAIPNNFTVWFTYKPSKTDVYEIGDNTSWINVEVYDKEFKMINNVKSGSYREPTAFMLKEDEEVFIKASYGSLATLTAVATNSMYDFGSNTEVTLAERTFTYGDYVYIAFTASEEGDYTFTSTGAGETGVKGDVLSSLPPNETSVQTISNYNEEMSVKVSDMTEKQKIWLKIQPYHSSTTWSGVTISVVKGEPEP